MVRFCEIIVDLDIALFQKRDQKTDYLILTNVVYMMREQTPLNRIFYREMLLIL